MFKNQLRAAMRTQRSAMILSGLILAVGVTAAGVRSQEAVRADQVLGGKLDAPIRIEVFSDFQCPACRAFYVSTIRQVLKDYCQTDKACVIYHEFPLAMHPYSREAARYSVAAQRLGRAQWAAVLDALYENQEKWSLDGKVDAAILGAGSPQDFAKIKKMLQEPSIEEAIVRDIALGQARQVKSTPTWFAASPATKEQRVEGPLEYKVLKPWMDNIIK
jgi:protein-disulfide isomerase